MFHLCYKHRASSANSFLHLVSPSARLDRDSVFAVRDLIAPSAWNKFMNVLSLHAKSVKNTCTVWKGINQIWRGFIWLSIRSELQRSQWCRRWECDYTDSGSNVCEPNSAAYVWRFHDRPSDMAPRSDMNSVRLDGFVVFVIYATYFKCLVMHWCLVHSLVLQSYKTLTCTTSLASYTVTRTICGRSHARL